MGVVPERACLISNETVGELAAHRHRILRDPGNAIHRIRDVDTVPVQRDTGADRLIVEVDLHQLTLYGTDFGSGRHAVQGVPGKRRTAGRLLLTCYQIDPYVRRTTGVGDQLDNRAGRHRAVPQLVVIMPSHREIRLHAAIVGVAHVHHRVRRRHQAGQPHPGQRSHDGHGGEDGKHDPNPASGTSRAHDRSAVRIVQISFVKTPRRRSDRRRHPLLGR